MPNYSVPSPSGQNVDVDAPNQDLANQFVAQRYFSGLEQLSNTASNPSSNTRPYQQNSLAQLLAAKRTGNPNATPTASDIYMAQNLQSQAESAAAAEADSQQRAELMKRQRQQARLSSIFEEDEPPAEVLLQEPPAQQSQPLPQQPNSGPQRPYWWMSPQRAALLQRLRQVRR